MECRLECWEEEKEEERREWSEGERRTRMMWEDEEGGRETLREGELQARGGRISCVISCALFSLFNDNVVQSCWLSVEERLC